MTTGLYENDDNIEIRLEDCPYAEVPLVGLVTLYRAAEFREDVGNRIVGCRIAKSTLKEPASKDECAAPHPLQLNSREGMWMQFCEGPLDGWFCFADHGNPPFDTPVQLLVTRKDDRSALLVMTGQRTRELKDDKEVWEVNSAVPAPFPIENGLTHWRFLNRPPLHLLVLGDKMREQRRFSVPVN